MTLDFGQTLGVLNGWLGARCVLCVTSAEVELVFLQGALMRADRVPDADGTGQGERHRFLFAGEGYGFWLRQDAFHSAHLDGAHRLVIVPTHGLALTLSRDNS